LRWHQPKLVIHCGGFTGKPNVDACETLRTETVLGNVVLAQTVAQACEAAGVRLAAISSGCIYTGAKVQGEDGSWTTREDLNAPDLADALTNRSPKIRGFDEADRPNFTFETGGSFYSGTKAAAERVLRDFPSAYVWRLRIPFEERNHPRNYLTKLRTYPKLYQNWNSLSHLGDFVSACLQLWEKEAPGGAYNVVNSGYLSTREVVSFFQKLRFPDWEPSFWRDDAEFYAKAALAPRSNCILETSKLAEAGITLREVASAMTEVIQHWG
jgi:dTDP-4-dehydrorhamnose reductase